MGFSEFLFETKKGKKFIGMLYGFGASIVMMGALFKIQHWPGAGPMLTVGLITEAIIFAFSAFEPPHMDVDWSLVYPELAGMGEEVDLLEEETSEDKGTITEQLDTMLEDARIGPDLIESLGTGLRSMAENANKMNDLSSAAASTSDYATSMSNAAEEVSKLSDSYVRASESLSRMVVSDEEGSAYADNLRSVAKNLSALNSIYELQLQTVNEHVQNTTKVYEGMDNLINDLGASIEGTRMYKENISKLADNLSSLNTVYGNMLTAMNVNPNG